jgi:hypothetical protein
MSALLAILHDRINTAKSHDELEGLQHLIWRSYGLAQLSDEDAQFLAEEIQKRKPGRGALAAKPVSNLNCGAISRFTPRPCRRRLTDEQRVKRRNRKRMFGGSSGLPDTLRHHFTEGERSVLFIMACEVKRQGYCDRSIDELGDRAGVGRTTAQNAMHEARRIGLIEITRRPQRGAKNLTNVVKIVSAEWLAWIKKWPSASRVIGSKFSKNVNTSETQDLRKQEAWQCKSRDRPPDLSQLEGQMPSDL